MTVPESVYTGARAFCPRPELWHSPGIQATKVEVVELVGAYGGGDRLGASRERALSARLEALLA